MPNCVPKIGLSEQDPITFAVRSDREQILPTLQVYLFEESLERDTTPPVKELQGRLEHSNKAKT